MVDKLPPTDDPGQEDEPPLEAPAEARARAEAPAEKTAPKPGFLTIFPGVMLAMFIAAIDQTILATALRSIAGSLGGFGLLSWVIVAYLLTATIAAPIYGRLGDVFGRRRMLLVALGLFVSASLLCASAQSMLGLVLARALQGFGGGGLMTLSQALIGQVVPPRERGRYMGYTGALFAASSAIGPVVGGYIVEHFSWQAVFLVNVPLGVLAALLALRLPSTRALPKVAFAFDWAGTALFALGTTSLLLGLTRAGSASGGGLPLAVAMIAVGVASLVAFVTWERRTVSPLIPPDLFQQPAVWRSDLTVIFTAGALISAVTYVPLYLQVARGFGASSAGLLLLPLTLALVSAGTLTGHLMSRTGRTTAFPALGLALAAAAAAALAFTTTGGSTGLVIGLVLLFGFGLGTVMPVMQTVVQVSAKREMLGSATASVSFARTIGGALGVASVGAVLVGSLSLIDARAAPLFTQLVEQGPTFMETLDPPGRALLEGHLSRAFTWAFGTIASFALIALAVSRTIPRTRL